MHLRQRLLTDRVVELGQEESDNLLQFLFRHSYRPEYQCRFRWENDSVAMWDNRCTQHRGINDFCRPSGSCSAFRWWMNSGPSMHPEGEKSLEFGDVPFVNTEDLFETKPEMAYGIRVDSMAS